MNDYLFITDLEINTKIGVLPHERLKKQPIIFNLKLYMDIHSPASEDDLSLALDYDDLIRQITSYVGSLDCHLIETLAEKTAKWILGNRRVVKVALEITKPEAIAGKTQVGVCIERSI